MKQRYESGLIGLNEEKKAPGIVDRVMAAFLWFSAGTFAGYLWMAKAYGLF